MTIPVAQRGYQQCVLRAGQTSTPVGATLSGQHRPSRRIILQIPIDTLPLLPKFPPSPTPISVWPCQNLKNLLYHATSLWIHSNVDVAALATSYDTPRAYKECDFSGLIKKPCACPMASMQTMEGLRWATAPDTLKSSAYRKWSIPIYFSQICSTITKSLST